MIHTARCGRAGRRLAAAAARQPWHTRNGRLTREAWGGIGSIDVAQRDAQEGLAAVGHLARLDELIGDPPGRIGRHGEAEALGGDALRCGDQSGDGDDLAVDVEQRTARIARVDRRVRLHHGLVVAALALRYWPVQRRDHTSGQRVVETEWIADGHDRIAHLQVGRGAERRGR